MLPAAAFDVAYGETTALAAAVVFDRWDAGVPLEEHAVQVEDIAPYEPGAFYRRELPCLLAVRRAFGPVGVLIVDGYVDLAPGRPGLGRHLFEALGTPVVGVAKTSFHAAQPVEVIRGQSARPLYVTAAGIDPAEAAAWVRSMHGEHRMPTLLKRVDALARGR